MHPHEALSNSVRSEELKRLGMLMPCPITFVTFAEFSLVLLVPYKQASLKCTMPIKLLPFGLGSAKGYYEVLG